MLSTSCVQQKDNQVSTLFGSQRLTQLCPTEIFHQKINPSEWRNSFGLPILREYSERFFFLRLAGKKARSTSNH